MTKILEKVEKLVTSVGFTIIGSVDEGGFPNVKAMLPVRERIGLKDFYLTTNTSSMRVKQYQENPKACLYFMDAKKFIGVMLVGKMMVQTDAETKKRISRLGDRIYYRGGVEDPDYCVLHFVAEKGRLYQNFGSKDFEVEIGD